MALRVIDSLALRYEPLIMLLGRVCIGSLYLVVGINHARELTWLTHFMVGLPGSAQAWAIQAATIEIGQQNAKRWLKILNDHWIGPKNQYLCGNQITIADYFGAALVTLGEVIRCDLSAYPNVQRWLNNMKKLPSWAPVNEVFHGLVDSVKQQQFHAI